MNRQRLRGAERFLDELYDNVIGPFLAILLISVIWWAYRNKEKMQFYGYIALSVAVVLLIIGIAVLIILKKKKRKSELDYFDDDKLQAMFKGMKPYKFEEEVADIFEGLGYKTELSGGPHDGGIDIIATKDGEKYYIQCKKYITTQASVSDVRGFYGAITGGLAKKGFFVTANTFTLDAEKFAEGKARLELIDGLELVRYYKLANSGKIEDVTAPASIEKCPQCGGNLIVRANRKTGEKFYGCSNYPNCHFMKSLK